MKGRHTPAKTGTQVKERLLHEKETSFDTEFMMTERRKGDLSSTTYVMVPVVSVTLTCMAAARARYVSTPILSLSRLL